MKKYWRSWRARAADNRAARREAKAPRRSHCQNCQTKLEGAYCYVCGQAAKEPRRAVIGLVQDVFVETLAIDGKLFRTIALLFRAPGILAKRFLDGQRVRYSPPFRLYLFASVFFFIAAFWSIGDFVVVRDSGAQSTVEELEELPPAVREELEKAQGDGLVTIDGETTSAAEAIENSEWSTDIEWLKPYVIQMGEAFDRAREDPRLFVAQARENVPRFLLLAPVVYALTLMLLYVYRRRFFVYDHFVVSLYMHAALYAFLFLALLISKIPYVGWLYWVPLVWGALQPILVQRQAYGSNWFSVIIKWAVANSIYWIAMGVIIALGFGYSLYQS